VYRKLPRYIPKMSIAYRMNCLILDGFGEMPRMSSILAQDRSFSNEFISAVLAFL
jgi:hypothetical protein